MLKSSIIQSLSTLRRRAGLVQSRRFASAVCGQGMTEYIIIVALIGVSAIGVYSAFGQTLRNQTAGLAQEIAGNDAGKSLENADKSSINAQTVANNRKDLKNYNQDNH